MSEKPKPNLPLLQWTITDHAGKRQYMIFADTEITEKDAGHLVDNHLFENARHSQLHHTFGEIYEFVQIVPPDGWHKPKEA